MRESTTTGVSPNPGGPTSDERKHLAAGFLAGFLGIPPNPEEAAGFPGQDSSGNVGFLYRPIDMLYKMNFENARSCVASGNTTRPEVSAGGCYFALHAKYHRPVVPL